MDLTEKKIADTLAKMEKELAQSRKEQKRIADALEKIIGALIEVAKNEGLLDQSGDTSPAEEKDENEPASLYGGNRCGFGAMLKTTASA